MIFDLLSDRPASVRADVCIVGAGAAGILLAVELLRLGKSVLLLEGGGSDIEDASQDPYRSEIVGLPHSGVHNGRFRAKSGTTTRWGGQILELDEADFQQRSWVSGSGWPFPKAELTPHYARALELEGMAPAIARDEDVWRAIDQQAPVFDDLDPYFSRWTPEPNFARLHHRALAENHGLSLWLHANAVELQMEGEQATGVRCRTLTGIEATFHANEYIFCLGSIESSRFFLQPRTGALPWNRSGLLGKHFQDHIDANAATVVPKSPGQFHRLFDNVFLKGYKYHPKLRLTHEAQARLQTLNVAATMVFTSDIDEILGQTKSTAKHLLQGRFDQLTLRDAASAVIRLPLLARQSFRYAVQHRAYNPDGGTIMLRVHCEQEPLGQSNITLAQDTSSGRDALGMIRTRLDWRISATELETIRQYVELARVSLAPVAGIMADPALSVDPASFIPRCNDSLHHMGGMKMAVSASDGVVDPNLRLHGTANVFVLSGAVFPTSGYSNPTHTLLALAMRLAVHLS